MSTVYAADWITHSALGSLLGYAVPPWIAFVIGFISHMVLDIWISEFKAFPIKKYWVWLLSQVAIVIALVLLPPANMAFGVLGAITPDVIDGIYGFFTKKKGGINLPKSLSSKSLKEWINDSNWSAGNLLFPFHRSDYNQNPKSLTLTQNVFIALVSLIPVIGLQLKHKIGDTKNEED